jgi:hypothetical protein
MENNLYVNKVYAAHFYLKIKPEQPLNIYGIKNKEEILLIGNELISSGIFCRAYYSVHWKETKRSRWKQEEYQFPQISNGILK